MASPHDERSPEFNRQARASREPDAVARGGSRRPLESLAADLAAHERRGELRHERYRAELTREAARARLDHLDGASERAMLADVALHRSLAGVYRDPETARAEFLATATERGAAEAVARLRDTPERYGRLATVRQSLLFGLLHREDARPARDAAFEAAARGREALEAERKLHEVGQSVRMQRIEAERAHDLRLVQQFTRELDGLYRDPARAQAEFEQIARSRGAEYAADSIRRHPRLHGEFKQTSRDGPALRQAVRRVARLAPEAARASRELPETEARIAREAGTLSRAPDVATERQLGATMLERATRRERAVIAELASLPSVEVLERRIVQAMQRVTPNDLRRLAQVATPAQIILAAQLKEAARQIAFGQDRGRGD